MKENLQEYSDVKIEISINNILADLLQERADWEDVSKDVIVSKALRVFLLDR
jgi:hypothetical protein